MDGDADFTGAAAASAVAAASAAKKGPAAAAAAGAAPLTVSAPAPAASRRRKPTPADLAHQRRSSDAAIAGRLYATSPLPGEAPASRSASSLGFSASSRSPFASLSRVPRVPGYVTKPSNEKKVRQEKILSTAKILPPTEPVAAWRPRQKTPPSLEPVPHPTMPVVPDDDPLARPAANRLPPVDKKLKFADDVAGGGRPKDRFLATDTLSDDTESETGSDETPRAPATAGAKEAPLPPTDTSILEYIAELRHKPDALEFVYLNPRENDGVRYNPYDLKIVSHADVNNNDFFTLSASGVTHFVNGVAEFTSLDQWEREHHLFNQILHIPLFQNYRLWKSYAVWRKNVRSKRMASCRQFLQQNLFILNPTLRAALLDIRVECERLNQLRLYRLKEDATHTLDEFVDLQDEQKKSITVTLLEFHDSVRVLARDACEHALDTAGFGADKSLGVDPSETPTAPGSRSGTRQQSRGPGSSPSLVSGPLGSPVPGLAGNLTPRALALANSTGGGQIHSARGGNVSAVSATAMGAATTTGPDGEQRMSYTELAAKRTECRRLTNFIKLTDYLVMDTLHNLAIGSIDDLCNLIAPDHSRDELPEDGFDGPYDGSVVGDDYSEIGSRPGTAATSASNTHMQPSRGGQGQGLSQPGAVATPRLGTAAASVSVAGTRPGTVADPPLTARTAARSALAEQERTSTAAASSADAGTAQGDHARTPARRVGELPPETPGDAASTRGGPMTAGTMVSETTGAQGMQAPELELTADEMQQRLLRERAKAVALFVVEILLSQDQLVFFPTAHEVLDNIESIVAEFINTVVAVEKLLTHEDFKPFTQPSFNERLESADTGEGPNLAAIILEDDRYQALVGDIKEALGHAFASAHEYSQTFEGFRKMYVDNKGVEFPAMLRETDNALEFFRAALKKYNAQRDEMDAMALASRIGIILVDSRQLKDSLLPSPQRCLDELDELLPVMAKARNEELLSEINDAIRKLGAQPTTVEEFVDYLAFLQDVTNRQAEVKEKYETVSQMYKLMEDHKVNVPPEDFALYQTLGPAFNALKTSITFSDASKMDNVNKFIFELDKNISKLKDSIMELKHQVQHPMIYNPESDIDEVLEYLGDYLTKIDGLKDQASRFMQYQGIFNVPVAKYQELDETHLDVNMKQLLWRSLKEWKEFTQGWIESPFESIDSDEINSAVLRFTKVIGQLDKVLANNIVVHRLKAMVNEFKFVVPVIMDLRNQSLKPRHWDRIQDVIQHRVVRDQSLTLGTLLELHVVDHKEAIAAISLEATNEQMLEEMIKKIDSTWSQTEFQVLAHRESKDAYIISNVEDIVALLEDSHVTVASISSSRYIAPIRNAVEEWDRQLALFSETLEEWMLCQRNWLYLESIFTAPDIQRSLPNLAKIFVGVDKAWKELMRKTKDYPNALRAATAPGVLETLQHSNEQLSKIQKGLEEYLETKRLAFPRFYFLSNDELLEILAQSRNPEAVQPHLQKLFDNLARLEFAASAEPKSMDVVAMISQERERVPLGKNLKTRGNVEAWLNTVEQSMFTSLRRLMKSGVLEYDKTPREVWVLEQPAQIALTVSQIFWARDTSEALSAGAVTGGTSVHKSLVSLKEKTAAGLFRLAQLVRGDLKPLQRTLLNSLITVDVHCRDILEQLIDESASSVHDFAWIKHMRYLWDTEVEDCLVRHTNATFTYGYEYLGSTSRLVRTHLTDRCYTTLTSALSMYMGGAPSGPAGTGKTETVKDLAKALAKQCVVFNCSDGLDYKMMGKFFSGLAQSGSWCCFDEFNRIDVEVLSVIAQQILTIKTALASKATKFYFEGQDIKLNPTCGYFITMNPGYEGRTELPDNLATLFRPAAMMIPDYAQIAEIILFAEGFESARILSLKMVNLYRLSSEQLSQQDHYDFGLRAIKSVLVMAGSLKRAHPDLREDIVLIRSLRDSNVPKFLSEDVPLFQAILADLFPNVDVPSQDYGELKSAIEESLLVQGKQVIPEQVNKVIQLYDTLQVRHGVMLVGPTFSGKTTSYQTLAQAMSFMQQGQTSGIGSGTAKLSRSIRDRDARGRGGQADGGPSAATTGGIPEIGDDDEPAGDADADDNNADAAAGDDDAAAAADAAGEDAAADAAAGEDGVAPTAEQSEAATAAAADGSLAANVAAMVAGGEKGGTLRAPAEVARHMSSANLAVAGNPLLGAAAATGSFGQSMVMVNATPGVKLFVLNPKCVTMGELYGEFNVTTHEWSDGLVASIVRQCVADTKRDQKWVVFDGPVDALWIENMNSVLDDNKTLCLANGERIRLNANIHMMFEVGDLAHASPATVSRCGMVYMQPSVVGYMPYVRSWVANVSETLAEAQQEYIVSLFEEYVPSGLAFVRQHCSEELVSVDANLVSSLCALFGYLLRPELGLDLTREREYLEPCLSSIFVFCYIWSIGANLDAGSQERFDRFARSHLERAAVIPPHLTMYDYFYDPKDAAFKQWETLVPTFRFSTVAAVHHVLVPTVDTVRYSYMLEALARQGRPVLLNGPSGVGKSVIVGDSLSKLSTDGEYATVTMNFSAQTSASRTQEIVESKLEKKRKNVLGGPSGRSVVLFVDDLNMPKPDQFGTSPALELIRQYQDFRGFYDRRRLFWKEVHDVTLVAACGPPGGGRNRVAPRLLRHFSLIHVPHPSPESMRKIFGAIVDVWMDRFPVDVKAMSSGLISGSVDLYQRISSELRPTPAKSHYTFNMRDLTKLVQGIMQVSPRSVTDRETIHNLWTHESLRVFGDRLVNDEDREYFAELLCELMRRHFDHHMPKERILGQDGREPILFGDYLNPTDAAAIDRQYEPVVSLGKVEQVLHSYLDDYNLNSSREMHLVFFKEAIEHISRISRIIRQPRGNALLVGVGGTGKQSLTRLACFMADYECFQIELTRAYGLAEFREDLKKMYLVTGVEGLPAVFLISDTQLVNDSFLEDINSILNSGEVPNLFELDEYEKVLNDMRPYVKSLSLPETRETLYSQFIQRVRDNLHIVLCMSPVGEAFRNRCRMFPSLVNCCTIDWFEEWPEQALLSVSQQIMAGMDLGEETDAEILKAVVPICVEIHRDVKEQADRYYMELQRRYYTTPTSYLELITLFESMLAEKREEIMSSRERLRSGLDKLLQTNEMVASMQNELKELQPILEVKVLETEQLLGQVARDQEISDGIRKVVMAEEAVVKEQTQKTEVLAEEAQKDLEEALPALEEAVKSLNSLNKNDISEIKHFTKPPDLVMTVMEAVCILLQAKNDWPTAKALLGDPGFLNKLVNFDKNHISETVLRRLKKYIDNPLFQPGTVAKVSMAAKSLCQWVRAIEHYSKVYKNVEPKRQRLHEAQSSLAKSKDALLQKESQLTEIEAELAALRRTYDEKQADKVRLAEKMEETSRRLQRASKLTTALADERVRWSSTISELEASLGDIVGNSLISAAFVAYLGAFTKPYRDTLVKKWVVSCQERGIPVSGNFSLISVLSDPVVVRDWHIGGLPRDDLSIENGLLVTRGRRWPLMIDPQGQAQRWIKNMETKNGLKVIRLSEPSFLRTLENSIRIGTPVLLEDVGETIDPALEPVLLKQTYRQGGRLLMRVGETDIDYDSNFRFYIMTKLSNPHYVPEIFIRVTVINFTVTQEGLSNQLLSEVVRRERPELEEQRDSIVVSTSADKKQLRELEDKILKLLQMSEGNLLDDEVLIDTLNDSKVTSGYIAQRVSDSEETEEQINKAREAYIPVAARGSLLFFAMSEMGMVDPMYQYSLQYFSRQFNGVIESTEPQDVLEERLETLIREITWAIFENVTRGLFEAHKVVFAFLIAVRILTQRKEVSELEWNFFIRPTTMMRADLPENPAPDLISSKEWTACNELPLWASPLSGIVDDIMSSLDAWRSSFFNCETPHSIELPAPYNEGGPSPLSAFQRLLLVKALRPSKLSLGMTDFVRTQLGRHFVEARPLDLERAVADTDVFTPLIFVLSQGADPVSNMMRFAREKGFAERFHMISLGQGQGPVAQALISKATKTGDWVFLQNCHLAQSWMPSLEKIVANLSASDAEVHGDFRLFLSSMPSPHFPASLLQNGVKVTNEPPRGLRANLIRSFGDLTEEDFVDSDNVRAWKKLLFGLSFFMAVVQERKRFGSLGWNIPYEFNQNDLEVSRTVLRQMLDEHETVPWAALRYLVGEINFGGRVTDDWDRRCLNTLLRQYFIPEIINDDYVFSQSAIYHALGSDVDLQGYREYIESLPMLEDPEIFGMHENALLVFEIKESQRVLDDVMTTQPKSAGLAAHKDPDNIILELVETTLKELPEILDERMAEASLLDLLPNGRPNSLTVVLFQEIKRYNRLLTVIRESLVVLQHAVRGLVVLSEDMELVESALLSGKVPGMWHTAAYPSTKSLASWLIDLKARITFMNEWLTKGQPTCFWLSGFFFPQGFLTGALQNHARKLSLPIDTLSFSFEVTAMASQSDVAEAPETGVYVHGLFLEGGQWDPKGETIADARLGERFCAMPVIHFLPTTNYERSTEVYVCPLYKTETRAGTLSTTGNSTNFVVSVDLPTKYPPEHWVKRGTALVCSMAN